MVRAWPGKRATYEWRVVRVSRRTLLIACRKSITVVCRIGRYDKRRTNPTFEHDSPRAKIGHIKVLAHIENSVGRMAAYELAPDNGNKIAQAINKTIYREGYVWCL